LVDDINEAIESWAARTIPTNWYFTGEGKDRAVREVQEVLQEIKKEATDRIEQEKMAVTEDKEKLQEEFDEEKKELEKIEAKIAQAMNDILPSWAGKLISVQTLVLLYPWLLVGIAMYLMGRAGFASRDFHRMADEKGLTAKERSDPLMSSMWTLTARGTLGTTITLTAYLIVLASLWYCLYLSQQPAQVEDISRLLEEGQIDSSTQSILLGIGHAFMVLVVAIALILPWRRRVKS